MSECRLGDQDRLGTVHLAALRHPLQSLPGPLDDEAGFRDPVGPVADLAGGHQPSTEHGGPVGLLPEIDGLRTRDPAAIPARHPARLDATDPLADAARGLHAHLVAAEGAPDRHARDILRPRDERGVVDQGDELVDRELGTAPPQREGVAVDGPEADQAAPLACPRRRGHDGDARVGGEVHADTEQGQRRGRGLHGDLPRSVNRTTASSWSRASRSSRSASTMRTRASSRSWRATSSRWAAATR